MVMVPSDLDGYDEDLARRVLMYARTIAPCLDSLTGENKSNALAILKGVAKEVAVAVSRQIAGQGLGPANVRYFEVASYFSIDDRAGLRFLCGASIVSAGPRGSFPPPSRHVQNLWPEPPYVS
jgi:hypothetical protein